MFLLYFLLTIPSQAMHSPLHSGLVPPHKNIKPFLSQGLRTHSFLCLEHPSPLLAPWLTPCQHAGLQLNVPLLRDLPWPLTPDYSSSRPPHPIHPWGWPQFSLCISSWGYLFTANQTVSVMKQGPHLFCFWLQSSTGHSTINLLNKWMNQHRNVGPELKQVAGFCISIQSLDPRQRLLQRRQS